MLQPYQLILEDPENVPVISGIQKEMLQARFSPSFQMLNGVQEFLKAKGHGPEYILGFLNGMAECSQMLDTFELVSKAKLEED